MPESQIGRLLARAASVDGLIKCIEYCNVVFFIKSKKASAIMPTHAPSTTSTKGGLPCRHPTRRTLPLLKETLRRAKRTTMRQAGELISLEKDITR